MSAKMLSCVDEEDRSSDSLQRSLREGHGISANDKDVELLEMHVMCDDNDEVHDVNNEISVETSGFIS